MRMILDEHLKSLNSKEWQSSHLVHELQTSKLIVPRTLHCQSTGDRHLTTMGLIGALAFRRMARKLANCRWFQQAHLIVGPPQAPTGCPLRNLLEPTRHNALKGECGSVGLLPQFLLHASSSAVNWSGSCPCLQADSRLVGSPINHRIQLVDCRLDVEGELRSWTQAVYKSLTAILMQCDPWEQRLRSVEDFAAVNGRLPRKDGKDSHERTLGSWLYFQCACIKQSQLGLRWGRLFSSSSALLRQRVEGWMSKDINCGFKRHCWQLKGYIEMYSELPRYTNKSPKSLSHVLAKWLNIQRFSGISNPCRRKILESVHPLVAELVSKWDVRTLRVDRPKWQARLSR